MGHANYVAVVEGMLSENKVAYARRDQLKRLGVPSGFQAPDLVIPQADGKLSFALVSGRLLKAEPWDSSTYNWLDRSRFLRFAQSEQCGTVDARIVFVYQVRRPAGPGLYQYQGTDFQVLEIAAADYQRRMRPRASVSWDKVDLERTIFGQLAQPLASRLQISRRNPEPILGTHSMLSPSFHNAELPASVVLSRTDCYDSHLI